MGWFTKVPAVLREQLGPTDAVVSLAESLDGATLAASRHGLWLVAGVGPEMLPWYRIATVRLAAGTLTVLPLRVVEVWDGIEVCAADTPQSHRFSRRQRLTDEVHNRVRNSVLAAQHLPWPRSGGWVALRRVAGRDGALRQVQLDAGADPAAPGFAEQVAACAQALAEGPL